jgi:hypothetical protein
MDRNRCEQMILGDFKGRGEGRKGREGKNSYIAVFNQEGK